MSPQYNKHNQRHRGGEYDRRPKPPAHHADIPSPYNFVELSDIIYSPDRATQVSHDVPFSDGISGVISVKAVAKTPIFVRDGSADEEKKTSHFFQLAKNKEYTIPSTTMKGMIRNIIEIISFGKMSRVDEHRYALRDLYSKDYTGKMTQVARSGGFRSQIKAGWLSIKNDQWVITPCQYARVEQTDLEEYHRTQAGNISIGTNRESSVKKYANWKIALDVSCDIDSQEKPYRHSCGILHYRKASKLGRGSQSGTIVFTGQPMSRVYPDGKRRNRAKHLEFIFYNPFNYTLDVDDELKKDFEFIHSDDRDKPNEEWQHWKRQLENQQRVPVFYLEGPKKNLHSMGLAMMYRLPYEYTIHDAIANVNSQHIDSNTPDLAETIFGYAREKDALRGRVQFGHFAAQNNPKPLSLVETVLGSPKPTYYPNYLRQYADSQGNVKDRDAKGKAKYKTFMDQDAQVRGWKRYPVRKDNFTPEPLKAPTDKVKVKFRPLPSGTVFTGKIRIHNLRPQELGALIWALSWGDNNNLRHAIGMAKPYGYGSVQLTIEASKLTDVHGKSIAPKTAIQKFEELMSKQVNNWKNSQQIQELLAMADPNASHPHKLEYPSLEKPNQFVQHKKNGKALRYYGEKKNSTVASGAGGGRYSNGDKVKCVAIDETTKKGARRWQIQGASEDYSGCVHPHHKNRIPPDLKIGDVHDMILFSYSKRNCQFKFLD